MIRAVFFDLDGTLVRYKGVEYESSWGAIGLAAGLGAQWDALLAKYKGRMELYGQWVEESAALLKGLPVKTVEAGIFPPPYAQGARQAVRQLRQEGYVLGIVSSGVSLVAERARDELGLHFAVANELVVQDGRFTGQAVIRVDLAGKLRAVEEEAHRLGLSLDEVAFVGDHFNDIPVLQAVGCGIAHAPKHPEAARVARFVVEDFHPIPKILRQLRVDGF